MPATVWEFGKFRVYPERIYFDTSILVAAFYEYEKYQPRHALLTGEALKRWRFTEKVHAFVVDLLQNGRVQCCISLLSFEESFNAVRKSVRSDTLAKRQVPNDLSDEKLRTECPDIWEECLRRSRSQLDALGKQLFQVKLNILVPNDQLNNPHGVGKIIARAQELLRCYDLHTADCFHLAVGLQFGVTDFAATDKAWQQVTGIAVYAHKRAPQWLTP